MIPIVGLLRMNEGHQTVHSTWPIEAPVNGCPCRSRLSRLSPWDQDQNRGPVSWELRRNPRSPNTGCVPCVPTTQQIFVSDSSRTTDYLSSRTLPAMRLRLRKVKAIAPCH
ncbi:hypothetical protein Cadr_000028933 [Camelus dromedarius]|uniref:Uncharacterized protein n=1 Tax=Camelus dromedarius TaxID=9838 RepID=A0A5N4C7C8_CAMDR|nr:hypothetical protein Cadr_000028933 [Camelus dromedarius]